jgi:hypothetical protein
VAADLLDLATHRVVRDRRAPAHHADQRDDRQQAEGDLEADPHVLEIA